MTAPRRETIGSAELWLGDCREILPTLPRPAAIVSDPPYGQAYRPPSGRRSNGNARGGWKDKGVKFAPVVGDDEAFDPSHLLDASDAVLLWGVHRFADRLPAGTWLVWDKRPNGVVRDQGDGEAAWLADGKPLRPMRLFRYLWDGLAMASSAADDGPGKRRLHPTQKPVALMTWCLEQARVPAGGLVCDPYMGSGTTGVAAVRNGFPFLGCEIDPAHFDTACRRIEEAQAAGPLFAAPPPAKARAPETADLFGGGA